MLTRTVRNLWIAAIVLSAASVGLLALNVQPKELPVNVLELRAYPNGGPNVVVQWDARQAVRQGTSAALLEVNDGGKFSRYPVDPATVQSGRLQYVRHSDDVTLTLTLLETGKQPWQGVVRVLAPNGAPAMLPPAEVQNAEVTSDPDSVKKKYAAKRAYHSGTRARSRR